MVALNVFLWLLWCEQGLLPPETSDSELNLSDGEIIVTPVVKMHLKSGEFGLGDCVKLDSVISGRPEPEVTVF